jgi:hypothetical protein
MTDDELAERLRIVSCGDDPVLDQAADRLKELARELSEETHSRKVAAEKAWEFADKLKTMEWQPIETAPRDGTSVLVAVYEEDGRYWGQDIVAWNDHIGWDSSGYDWQPNMILYWMPLPEPPNVSRETLGD